MNNLKQMGAAVVILVPLLFILSIDLLRYSDVSILQVLVDVDVLDSMWRKCSLLRVQP
jgi:hypothetical protein